MRFEMSLAGRATVAAGAAALLWLFAGTSAAQAQAPANDNRANAELTSGNSVNLLRDNFEATPNNLPGEAGEDLACGAAGFDSTVWFRYDPPAAGTAVYTVTGGAQFIGGDGSLPGDDGLLDTVMQLYNAGGVEQACNDDSGNGFQSQVTAFYGANNPSPVLVQVGGFDYGAGTFFEWGAFNFIVNYSAATRVAASRVKGKFRRFEKYDLLKRAQISVEAGTTTLVKCSGGGCKRGSTTFTSGPISLRGIFKGGRAPKGSVLDIFVTEPSRFGYYLQVKFRGLKAPVQKTRCLAAGDTTPTKGDVTQCPA